MPIDRSAARKDTIIDLLTNAPDGLTIKGDLVGLTGFNYYTLYKTMQELQHDGMVTLRGTTRDRSDIWYATSSSKMPFVPMGDNLTPRADDVIKAWWDKIPSSDLRMNDIIYTTLLACFVKAYNPEYTPNGWPHNYRQSLTQLLNRLENAVKTVSFMLNDPRLWNDSRLTEILAADGKFTPAELIAKLNELNKDRG